MKINLIAFIGATTAFFTSGIITLRLLNRRRTSSSFRELYEDNAIVKPVHFTDKEIGLFHTLVDQHYSEISSTFYPEDDPSPYIEEYLNFLHDLMTKIEHSGFFS